MTLNPSDLGTPAFNYETENKYLKLTIIALREKIEKQEILQEDNIQKTISMSIIKFYPKKHKIRNYSE